MTLAAPPTPIAAPAAPVPAPGTLDHWLADFRDRFNGNARAAKLTAGWERKLLVDATDTGRVAVLTVSGARVTEIGESSNEASDTGDETAVVTMRAGEDTLIEIFAGRYNPSSALIDGQLEVYSDARDKVKLEALALVIWGL
jgi:hypothetical protein